MATTEAIVKTGKALGTLMTPIVESINNAMYYDNREVA